MTDRVIWLRSRYAGVPQYWQVLPREAKVALVAGIALALVLVWALLSPFARLWSAGSERIDEIEPRFARMLGFEQTGDQLSQALRAASAQRALLIYEDGINGAEVGAQLQQRVRDLATAAGMTVNSSQLLGEEVHDGLEKLPVNLQMSGSVASLLMLLTDLSEERPVLVVDSLQVNALRPRRGDAGQVISVGLRVSAFHAAPGDLE